MEKTAEKKLNNLWLPQVLEICGNQFSLRVVCFNLMVSGVKRMVCNKHEHDFYEMHYITKGSLEICVDDRTHLAVREGDFVIYKPFMMHQNVNAENGTQKYGFCFYLDSADEKILSALEALTERRESVWHGTEQMQLMVEAINNCTKNYNYTNQTIIKLLLEAFFLEMLNSVLKDEPVKDSVVMPSEKNSVMENINTYVALNAHRPLTVEEVATKMFFSTRQFSRIVRLHCGCTPGELIAEARLKYIKKLLLESEMSVTEVAQATGFKDVSSLVKYFRGHVGMTPASYREKCRISTQKIEEISMIK